MSLDLRDTIIQQHAPTLMQPIHTAVAPLDRPGHRYLAAADGMYLEVRRPWLHLVQPIAPVITGKLPYGVVASRIATEFGKIPRELLVRFLEEARKLSPFEHAAWIVWNDSTRALEYRELDVQEMTHGSVRFNRPHLEEHESLAIDLHSHGILDAFFSATDDADDAGEVKISGVLGNLRPDGSPSWRFRLCALGIFRDLPGPKDL